MPTILLLLAVAATPLSYGAECTFTHVLGLVSGNAYKTNVLDSTQNGGRLTIDYDFVIAPDRMTSVPKIVIGSPPFVPTLEIRVSRVMVKQNVVLGRRYVLESSNDFDAWTATGPPFTAESEVIENEFVVEETGQFFRIFEVP